MANYSDIRGYRVKYLSSDPTLSTANEGQVWYNSTSDTLKSLVQIKAFSAGGNMSNTRYYSGSVGTQTDMLGITGQQSASMTTATEAYNGYAWTSGGAVNTARRAVYSFGTPTAAVIAGGDFVGTPGGPTSTATEEYNGTSWTTGNPIVSQGSFGASAGTLTAGLAFGGDNPTQSGLSKITVSYDGTNWTSLPSPGSDTNVGRDFTGGGGGTQTAAIFSGGSPAPVSNSTESWNGSIWSVENNMNTGRNGQGFLGTQANGLYAGGSIPGRTTATEEWDGANWSTSSASLSTARNGSVLSKGGSLNAAAIAGGYTGTAYPTATEEYNSNINALTKAVWSSGGSLPAGRLDGVSGTLQTQNAAYVAGGENATGPSYVYNTTFEYNGSTWSPSGNLSTARAQAAGAGTQTAGLASGGVIYDTSPYPAQAAVEEYNGSTWTTGTGLPAARTASTGTGSQTAALVFGGNPGFTTTTISYNGSAWSSENPTNSSKVISAGAGPQTATIASQGGSAATEEYNGTSWTSLSDAPYAASNIGGFGTQTAFVTSGGTVAPVTPSTDGVTFTSYYDGTGWSSSAPMTQGRRTGGSPTGSHSAGLATGGFSTPTSYIAACEEYTGNTATATASTLTTS